MQFIHQIEQKGDVSVIRIKGNLIEKGQAAALIEEIEDLLLNHKNKYIIDLAEFNYMNSIGLNVLVSILTRARKTGGEAIVCSVPKKIKELLIVTKLNTVFTIADTPEDALKQLK